MISFSKRIKLFFYKRNILVSDKSDADYIDFLFMRFKAQHRSKITPVFIIDATSDYLKLSPPKVIDLIRSTQSYRPSIFSKKKDNIDDFLCKSYLNKNKLLYCLGQKHKPKFKITKITGSPLSPITKAQVQAHTAEHDVSFSALKPTTTPNKGRPRALAHNKRYICQMKSQTFGLWREESPIKPLDNHSPYRVQIEKEKRHASSHNSHRELFQTNNENPHVDKFEFSVCAEDITQRIGAKRPISQQQIMGNQSAYDVLVALGAIIHEKQNGRHYHWAHRHGWSLNGPQNKENLDPTTAGSNYDTLFLVEAPIKHLIFNRGVEKILVNGKVEFHPTTPIPQKIVYELTWGTGGFMEVFIDPLCSRIPTIDEHKMSTTLFSLVDSKAQLPLEEPPILDPGYR